MSNALRDRFECDVFRMLQLPNIPEVKVTYAAGSPTEWASGTPREWRSDSGDMPSWQELFWDAWESQAPSPSAAILEWSKDVKLEFVDSESSEVLGRSAGMEAREHCEGYISDRLADAVRDIVGGPSFFLTNDSSWLKDIERSILEWAEEGVHSRIALDNSRFADLLAWISRTTFTNEAYEYVLGNQLGDALLAVISAINDCITYKTLHLSVSEYDDMSGMQLLKVTIEAGLRGTEAVEKEDELLDRLFDAIGPETVNAFVIEVD
ncbi:MAG: hypothetical protein ACLFWL_13205 [Candidatus Brocadiia bacterium]